jgi:hypothetical protein
MDKGRYPGVKMTQLCCAPTTAAVAEPDRPQTSGICDGGQCCRWRIDGWSLTSCNSVSENRRTVDQARTLLLAAACRESSDAAALWRHAAEDHRTAIACEIGDPPGGADIGDAAGWRKGKTVGGIYLTNSSFGRCVTVCGRTGQLRHHSKALRSD